jgi:hypothetical protein
MEYTYTDRDHPLERLHILAFSAPDFQRLPAGYSRKKPLLNDQ